MVAQTPGCRARRSLRRRPGTKCLEWRKKKRSVPEGQDDCVGAAFDSITELSTCQHDLCRLTRENLITPSLPGRAPFSYAIPGTSCQATIVQSLRDWEDKPQLSQRLRTEALG